MQHAYPKVGVTYTLLSYNRNQLHTVPSTTEPHSRAPLQKAMQPTRDAASNGVDAGHACPEIAITFNPLPYTQHSPAAIHLAFWEQQAL
jgi:hypothetical protein